MKKTFGINAAIEELCEFWPYALDTSATTIRCAINDLLDAASKDGQKVNFNYDQDRAVRIVKARRLAARHNPATLSL
jgi:hypothetical protein